jgi:hypothetical protein
MTKIDPKSAPKLAKTPKITKIGKNTKIAKNTQNRQNWQKTPKSSNGKNRVSGTPLGSIFDRTPF